MNRILIFLACASVLFGRDAPASAEPLNAEGYAYFGGNCNKDDSCYSMLIGGGGNGYIYRGLYAGGEIGFVAKPSAFNQGLGRSFINAGYSAVNRDSPGWVVPFAEFGVGGYFRESGIWMAKLGGGATVWVHKNVGIRGAAFWERPLGNRSSYYSFATVTLGVSFRWQSDW